MAFFHHLSSLFGLTLLLAALATAAPSSGCGKALASGIKTGGQGSSNKINFTTTKGAARTFLLHIPTTYTANIPRGLIFSFHGRGESGSQQESLSKLSDPKFNPEALVVYPDGIDNEWQGDPDAKTDDVGFTLDMIDSLSKQYCIDTDRIYATGMSNGGGFSANILACDPNASKKLAAVAGVSGAYYQGTTETNCQPATVAITCNPGRKPFPVLEFHGTSDGVIPYTGGPRRSRCLPNLPHFVTEWAVRNGLGSSNQSSSLFNGGVTKYTFGSGSQADLTTHYKIEGMGHSWPSAGGNYLDAAPVIVEFFNKWTLSGKAFVPGSAPASTFSTSTKSSTTPAKASSSASTSKATATTTSAPPASTNICPAQDGKSYASSGKTFQITCSADTTNAVYGTSQSGDFATCIAQCASESQCGHVTFVSGACYKKAGAPGKVTKTSGSSVRVAVKL